jgi:ATP-dependent DNA helicase RecQ
MRDVALQLLQKALATPAADFRAGQWECIEGILKSQRQLVVQKTGWGKSMALVFATRGNERFSGKVVAFRSRNGAEDDAG